MAGEAHELAQRDALYIGMGAGDVRFESVDVNKPAKYYLVSTPAHARLRDIKIPKDKANSFELGEHGAANKRTISQIHHSGGLPVLPARHGHDAT